MGRFSTITIIPIAAASIPTQISQNKMNRNLKVTEVKVDSGFV